MEYKPFSENVVDYESLLPKRPSLSRIMDTIETYMLATFRELTIDKFHLVGGDIHCHVGDMDYYICTQPTWYIENDKAQWVAEMRYYRHGTLMSHAVIPLTPLEATQVWQVELTIEAPRYLLSPCYTLLHLRTTAKPPNASSDSAAGSGTSTTRNPARGSS